MLHTLNIQHYARQDLPVFITGDIGTGKSSIAHMLHSLSPRKHRPFFTVLSRDCSPSKVLEWEIFGIEKTDHTPINDHQRGKLELANGGTLVFDNLEELPIYLQEKVLHCINNQSFQRTYTKKATDLNVRVIGTSRKDPQELLNCQILHPQLYDKLHQLHIHLPPLASRKDWIEELAHTLLSTISKQMHKTILGFSPESKDFLRSYAWPGNLRQLHNILERAVILEESKWIQMTSLFFPEMKPMKFHNAFM